MRCTTTLAALAGLLLATSTPTVLAGTGDDLSFSDILRTSGFDSQWSTDIRAREFEARRRIIRAERWSEGTARDFARQWRRAESKAKLAAVRDALDDMVADGTVTRAVAQQRLERVERQLRQPARELRFDEPTARTPDQPVARPTAAEMAKRIKASFLEEQRRLRDAVTDGRITDEQARARRATALRSLLSRLDLMDGRRHHAQLQNRMAKHQSAGESQAELRRTLHRLTGLMNIERQITRIEHEVDLGLLAPDAASARLEELRALERRSAG